MSITSSSPAAMRWPSRRWWRARTRRLRRPRPAAPHRRVPRGPGTTAPRRRPTTPTSPSARRAGGAFRPRRRRRVERKLAASSERNFSFERNFFGASLFELLESAKHEAGGQVDGGRAGAAVMSPKLLAVVLLLVARPLCAETYKWVDEKGVTNYSSSPPANAKLAEKTQVVEESLSVYTPDPGLLRAIQARPPMSAPMPYAPAGAYAHYAAATQPMYDGYA